MKYVKKSTAPLLHCLCVLFLTSLSPSAISTHNSHSSLRSIPLLVHALLEGFLFLSFLPFMSNLSFMRPFSSPLPSISIPLSQQQYPHDAKMAPDAPALALL